MNESDLAYLSLHDLPAMSIRCGFDRNNVPIDIQIIGPRLRENLVLADSHVFQQATDYRLRRPPFDSIGKE